jgi:excisionase family DNA binding protein
MPRPTSGTATYSVDEVAQLLGVNRLTVYQAIQRQETPFPIVRIGRRIVIPRAAFNRVLEGEAVES